MVKAVLLVKALSFSRKKPSKVKAFSSRVKAVLLVKAKSFPGRKYSEFTNSDGQNGTKTVIFFLF